MKALHLYDEICSVCSAFGISLDDYKYKMPFLSKHNTRDCRMIIADVSIKVIMEWDKDYVRYIEIGQGKKIGIYNVADNGLSRQQLIRICKRIVLVREQEKDRRDSSRHRTRMLMRAEKMIAETRQYVPKFNELVKKLGLRLHARVDRDNEPFVEARVHKIECFDDVDSAVEWINSLLAKGST